MKPSLFFTETSSPVVKSFINSGSNTFFTLADTANKASFVIHIDPKKTTRIGDGKEILVQVEPEVVRPDLYTRKIFETYDYIIPISEERATRQGLDYWIELPIEIPSYKRTKREKLKFAALVNEHKFSAVNRSKYGLRRDVIKLCNSKGIELSLFGKQWNEAKTIAFRRRLYALRMAINARSPISISECFGDLLYPFHSCGLMDPEGRGLQEFKYSIVIENDLDYVSEKIWKSLYAGSIPIYVGPNLEKYGMISELIFPSIDRASSVVEALERARKVNIFKWRVEVDKCLDSIKKKERKDSIRFWRELHEILVNVNP